MYFFWWNKPLNVRVPIYVAVYGTIDAIADGDLDWSVDGDIGISGIIWESSEDILQPNVTSGGERHKKTAEKAISRMKANTSDAQNVKNQTPTRRNTRGLYMVTHIGQQHMLTRAVLLPYRRLLEMRERRVYISNIQEFTKRIPTFYAYPSALDSRRKDALFLHLIALLSSTLFGFIHLASWNTTFPTLIETHLWHAATITIIVAPPFYAVPVIVAQALLYPMKGLERLGTTWRLPFLKMLSPIYTISKYVLPALYIIARMILLVEAVVTLRALPASALSTIPWTNYIPHI